MPRKRQELVNMPRKPGQAILSKAPYDVIITLKKALKYLLFYGIPLGIAAFVQFYPAISGLTIGTLLTMLANFIKNRNK